VRGDGYKDYEREGREIEREGGEDETLRRERMSDRSEGGGREDGEVGGVRERMRGMVRRSTVLYY
jgi:hypothetical protein